MRYIKKNDTNMMTSFLSLHLKGLKDSQMMCLFALKALYVRLIQHFRQITSCPVKKEVKSRFLRFEFCIDFLLTFAADQKSVVALDGQ